MACNTSEMELKLSSPSPTGGIIVELERQKQKESRENNQKEAGQGKNATEHFVFRDISGVHREHSGDEDRTSENEEKEEVAPTFVALLDLQTAKGADESFLPNQPIWEANVQQEDAQPNLPRSDDEPPAFKLVSEFLRSHESREYSDAKSEEHSRRSAT